MGEFEQSSENSIVNTSKYSEEQIKRSYEDVDFADFDNSLAIHLERKFKANEQLRLEVEKRLVGKNLVDLGCGPDAVSGVYRGRRILKESGSDQDFPFLVRMARNCQALSYTGVDMSNDFLHEGARHFILGGEKEQKEISAASGIDTRFVYDEMLHYIHSLPDASACYTISGIAPELIQGVGKSRNETDWYKYLLEELGRTTASGGIIFGIDSGILYPEKLEGAGFKPLDRDSADPSNLFVYIKE